MFILILKGNEYDCVKSEKRFNEIISFVFVKLIKIYICEG